MKTIFSQIINSTLAQLVQRYSASRERPARIEAWVFADQTMRNRAETALHELGINAKIRSAYKPLLHYFLEQFCLDEHDYTAIEVVYPCCAPATEKRFLLEAYPLGALVNDCPLTFTKGAHDSLTYEVRITRTGGATETVAVLAPNLTHTSVCGEQILTPTGWVKEFNGAGECVCDERLATDFELAYNALLQAVIEHDWPQQSPYFTQLQLQVAMPVSDEPLGYAHEVISLKEALHEDLYFSVQEWFKYREGKSLIARDSQPGQIVPVITSSPDNDYHLQLALCEYLPEENTSVKVLTPLEQVAGPLAIAEVNQRLAQIQGEAFSVSTPTGRQVQARHHEGSDKAVLISGGQHANETTGVVGALRAAEVLALQAQANFVLVPLSNPDGYALHQFYIKENPYHMHHAARYTALGDDLEHRTVAPLYEKGIRQRALEQSGAQLHINLHGYPSHEWTRPLSGYVPQGFDMWTIPKGFFLVIRHKNDPFWADIAQRFVTEVTRRLNDYPAVMAMNRAQVALYEQHAGETGFVMINDYPCLISAMDECDFPLQLITEYPDETIYGDDFIAGHTVQKATALAAYEVYQSLLSA